MANNYQAGTLQRIGKKSVVINNEMDLKLKLFGLSRGTGFMKRAAKVNQCSKKMNCNTI